MNESKMIQWLANVWDTREGALSKKKSILLLDSFEAHRTEAVKRRIAEGKGLLVIIPGGTTSSLQPLDVLINRAFKKHLKDLWHKWMAENRHHLTAAGNIKSPGRGDVATWVVQAWEAIDIALIRKAYFKSGISKRTPREDPVDMEVDCEEPSVADIDSCPLFQTPSSYLDYSDCEIDLNLEALSLCD